MNDHNMLDADDGRLRLGHLARAPYSFSSPPAGSAFVSFGGALRCMPLTMSSIRMSIDVISTAVLIVCSFTTSGSHTPISRMSAITPFTPSIPHIASVCLPAAYAAACLARSSVTMRTTSHPQFCASVRGITSNAMPTALYGHCSVPSTFLADAVSATDSAISVAPPPGTSIGAWNTLRATFIASSRLRSTSFSTSFDAPRSRMVHALGESQSTKKVKYSSPILVTSNSPQPVPTSDSFASSGRLTILAPVARAMRLLSVLRMRRKTVTPALTRKCCARSETPFSVTTTSGLSSRMSRHTLATQSSSCLSSASHWDSSVSSTDVADSFFLYSRVQSRSSTRGRSMRRFILGCVTSLFTITPLSTRECSMSPPGSFSTLAYRLMSISLRPFSSVYTVSTASSARSTICSAKREMNLVPIEEFTILASSARLLRSMGNAIARSALSASSSARA
mmetsp:Transcript_17165/g.44401  ORF Transcript_17165/g.44401 Transcript_17165/m.44401 type:complete len:451 (+) Transcript_17165:254-1606(+)